MKEKDCDYEYQHSYLSTGSDDHTYQRIYDI